MTKSKRIHYADRTVEELLVGENYYISWSGEKAIRVKVLEIDKTRNQAEVEILEGKKRGSTHGLFLDEIRSTPEDAKLNCVTL